MMNVTESTIRYAFDSDAVYPKYSFMDASVLIWSGFREQSVHL
jgi:hypothetical protein